MRQQISSSLSKGNKIRQIFLEENFNQKVSESLPAQRQSITLRTPTGALSCGDRHADAGNHASGVAHPAGNRSCSVFARPWSTSSPTTAAAAGAPSARQPATRDAPSRAAIFSTMVSEFAQRDTCRRPWRRATILWCPAHELTTEPG